jgi:hypothetical protein
MEIFELKLTDINERLKSLNRVTFTIILSFALFLTNVVFNLLISFFEKFDIVWFRFPGPDDGIIFLFILAVIIAPVAETFIGQYLPYYLLNKIKYFNERSYLILLSSALFFGLNHFYSLFYMIYGFFTGLILMYGYMVRIKTDNKTFYLVAISHAFVNLSAFIINVSDFNNTIQAG